MERRIGVPIIVEKTKHLEQSCTEFGLQRDGIATLIPTGTLAARWQIRAQSYRYPGTSR